MSAPASELPYPIELIRYFHISLHSLWLFHTVPSVLLFRAQKDPTFRLRASPSPRWPPDPPAQRGAGEVGVFLVLPTGFRLAFCRISVLGSGVTRRPPFPARCPAVVVPGCSRCPKWLLRSTAHKLRWKKKSFSSFLSVRGSDDFMMGSFINWK